MNDSVSLSDDEIWSRLTDKQRACLDLLLERMTSKKIARELGISKDTVDQRITSARHILGAADRDAAAIAYARLKSIYDRVAYDPVEVASPVRPMAPPTADGDAFNVLKLGDSMAAENGSAGTGSPFGKIWRADHRTKGRIMITAGLLLAIVILVFLGLGIAQSLSQLLSG